jgi:hypothetical protein
MPRLRRDKTARPAFIRLRHGKREGENDLRRTLVESDPAGGEDSMGQGAWSRVKAVAHAVGTGESAAAEAPEVRSRKSFVHATKGAKPEKLNGASRDERHRR